MNHKNDESQRNRITSGGWSSDRPITLMNSVYAHAERLRRSHRRLFETEPSLQPFLARLLRSSAEDDNDHIETLRHRSAQSFIADRLRILEILEAVSRLYDEIIDEHPNDDSHDQLSD